MPYKNVKVKIPLCETCAAAYRPTKDAEIIIAEYSKGCIAHYVDLDTITCLKKITPEKEK